MNKTTATTCSRNFVRLTRCLGYMKVYLDNPEAANEEDIIELARGAAPIGWIADTGALFSTGKGCWMVDFKLGDRS